LNGLAIDVNEVIELHKMGFKLIPLCADAKTPNVSDLLTNEEKQESIEESADNRTACQLHI
jgi:hypothetical protein